MHTTPLFNPITGDELKSMVMGAIDRSMVESGEFDGHQTFPKFSYHFRLEVKVYPSSVPDKVAFIEGTATIEGERDLTAEETSAARVLTFSQEAGVDTPDLAREQHNLPIPTPALGKDGVVRDKMVMSPRPSDPPPVEVTTRLASEPEPGPTPPALVEGETEADAFDPAAELAKAGPISEEAKAAIYANATELTRGRPKAVSVEIQNKANPGGVKAGKTR